MFAPFTLQVYGWRSIPPGTSTTTLLANMGDPNGPTGWRPGWEALCWGLFHEPNAKGHFVGSFNEVVVASYFHNICLVPAERGAPLSPEQGGTAPEILQPCAAAVPPVCRSSIGLGGHLFPGLHRERHRTDSGTDIVEGWDAPLLLSFLLQQPVPKKWQGQAK